MNNQCSLFRKNIVAYLDRELPDHQAGTLAEHLKGCPDCRHELAQLQEALQQLPALPLIQPSGDYDRVFWDKIRALRSKKIDRRQSLFSSVWLFLTRRTGFTATAAIAVCLSLATFFALRSPRELSRDDIMIARDIELFSNMEVIENSDALEHFEVIQQLDAFAEDANG